MSKQLLKSTAVVSVMTFVSRILGFIRDMVFAATFGAGSALDAFFVAFKIPNFLRRLFAEGAFAQSFVPVLAEYKETKDPQLVRQLISQVSGTLGAILLLVSTVGMLAAPVFTFLFSAGWYFNEPSKFALASDLLSITFSYIFFISLVALAGGALNTFGRFAIPAITPIWLNISFLVAALWGKDYFERPIDALAWAVFAAGAIQLLFQFPSLRSIKMLTWPVWAWRSEAVQKILKLMIPVIIGSSVVQISLVVDTIAASLLQDGSVSWLYFSDRLMEFPLGIFAIALSTVVLPSLSKKHASASTAAFSLQLDWALRIVILIALPAAAALVVLSGPLLVTLFQYGKFDAHQVVMTQWSLYAYGVGLLGFSLIKVLTPGFYARQDTKTPVKIAIKSLIVAMSLNAIYVVPLVYIDFEAPHLGLAAATATGAFVNAFLLYKALRGNSVYQPLAGWLKYGLQVLTATVVMISVLVYIQGDLSVWLQRDIPQRATNLAICVLAGAASYFISLLLSGWRLSALKH